MRFDYVYHLTITNNGFHKGGRAAEGGPPTFVEAAEGRLHYIGDGEVANIVKMHAYTYKMCPCSHISLIY